MIKEFDRWNGTKKKMDLKVQAVDFHEREIWWCSIGVNIGSEQHSQSVDFSRPVIIVKKFTNRIFLGIPLTTKNRKGLFRISFLLGSVLNDMLVLQMRSFDRKRLINKIGMLPQAEFDSLNTFIAQLFTKSMKTPIDGVSEAEASVFTEFHVETSYTRSIEEHRLLSRFYGELYAYRMYRSGICL